MSRHFAFVVPPAHGHINPSLPLVEELVRRGHRVTFATGADMLPVVEGAGATALELPTEMPPGPPSAANFGPERFAEMTRWLTADARRSIPILRARLEQDRPDAVCYDMLTIIGRVLAELLGLPEVALLPSFAANEQLSLHERFMPAAFDPQHPALLAAVEEMGDLAEEYGVSRPQMPFSAKPAPLNLVFLPERFQIAAETFDDRFRFLGPAIAGHRHAERWEPAKRDAPVLFISLGTVFNNRPDFFRMCVEAFAGSSLQVAMATGSRIDLAELGEIPANFDIRPTFPQIAVLEHASVFLSHTGMNSTMESLHHGVPLVAFPQMPEQAANADRVEELGLGRRVPDDVDAGTLREVVEKVASDEHIRANVTAMRETVRSCGGPASGADALESYVQV